MKKQPAVYILASAKNGTLYTGVTSDLVKRIWEHKNNLVDGFTKRYGVHDLVWFELPSIRTAVVYLGDVVGTDGAGFLVAGRFDCVPLQDAHLTVDDRFMVSRWAWLLAGANDLCLCDPRH